MGLLGLTRADVARWTVRALACAAFGVAVGAVTGSRVDARQKDVPALSGVWKLNVEASTSPDGPASARGGSRSGGGGGRGADGLPTLGSGVQGSSGGFSGPPPGGDLGPEELARFNAIKAYFFKAPVMMGVQATATDFKLLLDPEKNFGYGHKTDNKKSPITTPAGPAEAKVKWDGAKLRREIETKDSYHLVEEYMLSADGKQLIVTVKADSQMVRNVQPAEIKRVYDRQAQ
jgi:hypothetical protein